MTRTTIQNPARKPRRSISTHGASLADSYKYLSPDEKRRFIQEIDHWHHRNGTPPPYGCGAIS